MFETLDEREPDGEPRERVGAVVSTVALETPKVLVWEVVMELRAVSWHLTYLVKLAPLVRPVIVEV